MPGIDHLFQDKLFKPLFWLSLATSLLPLFLHPYFLTGDGPTHLYNARILSDWMLGEHRDFYQTFYFLNLQLDPNWTGHTLLGLFMLLFPAFVAEKIFLVLYVLLFGGGCYFLMKQLNPENSFLALLGLPFIYHFTFFKGFWNCAVSLALAFWVIVWWVKHRHTMTNLSLVKGGTLLVLLYFTHLIGLMMAVSIMVGMVIVESFAGKQNRKQQPVQQFWMQARWLSRVLMPVSLLTGAYLYRVGLNPAPSNLAALKHLDYYVILNGLQSIDMNMVQHIGVKVIAFTFHALLVWGLVTKLKSKTLHTYDGFLLAFLGVFLLYLFLPESIAGGSVLMKRVQIVPYLMLLGWFSQFSYPKWAKTGLSFVVTLTVMGLVLSRFPAHFRIQQGLDSYLSVQAHIEPHSTVLPLSFDHYGVDEVGNRLSDMWLFIHAADYLGAEKPLALLSNYEASSGAFPLVYRYEMNPFNLIGTHEGIEHQPPSVDILHFQQETGISVDYVVTWCLDQADQTHPYIQDIHRQLDQSYELVYTSSNMKAQVFRFSGRNNIP